MPQAE
jgi:hypothetical protein